MATNMFNTNMPYQNPMYGTGMYPQINYPTQSPMKHVLPGSMVDNVDEIYPSDVPTDGSVALFPRKDGTCIYAKYWTPDGNIVTKTFVPGKTEEPAKVNSSPDNISEDNDISKKLDEILSLLKKQSYNKRKYNNQKPKETIVKGEIINDA